MVRCISPVSRSYQVASTLFNIQFYIHTTVPLENACVNVTQYFNPQTQTWMNVCGVSVTSYLCAESYCSDSKGIANLCLPYGKFKGNVYYQNYMQPFEITVTGNEYIDFPFFFTIQLFDVTFTESGLPSGTSWSVTFNNQTQISSTDSMTFKVPNGSYSYSIGSVNGYNPSPSSGTIIVNNAPVTQTITFSSATIEYVYAGYSTNPGIVDQIDPSTMTLVKEFTAPSGHGLVYALTYDGTYIYAGYISGYIDQIDPSTMSLIKTFTAPSGHIYLVRLTYDGTYIYAGYFSSPGIVDQIDPVTMTLVKTFIAPSGHNKVFGLTYDGTYIYAGYYISPGIVDQIDPVTMTLVKTFTAPSGHNEIYGLTYDGTYIYAGYLTSPGYVDQIDPTTMTLVKTFIAPSGHNKIRPLTYDGMYIYAGYSTAPGIVDQINPLTMSMVKTFTAPSGHNQIFALTYDGTYIYTGYITLPGYVDQIDPSTMTLVKTFTAPSAQSSVMSLTQNKIKGNNYAVFK